ncbi:MAG: HAD-IC family P-type ATPase, partial [Planctomycetota bacterium]
LSAARVRVPPMLILATPSAVLAALAWLARSGVVIKGSAALERLALVDTIVFDKTGTLTTGQPAIGDVFCFGLITADDVLRIAAAAERYSEHVLGRLVVEEAGRRGLDVPVPKDFTAHPGAGITAWVSKSALQGNDRQHHLLLRGGPEDLCQIRVGNVRFFDSQGLNVAEHLQGWLASLDETGQTPILVAVQDTVIGLIGARDTVRADARDVLKTLRSEGRLTFALLTGDRMAPARQIVGSVGAFETVAAELLPADKARWIETQQQAGRKVLMVGDGINDAPALATADVGIALGGVGSQIASEAGDIILMGSPLAPLPGLLRLSRELVRVIRQSIYWFAFGLNGIGVLLCATGWLNPVGAALFHEVASLAVMLNALRLLWFERWETSGVGRLATGCSRCVELTIDALSPSRAAQALVRYWSLVVRLSFAAVAAVWLLSNLVLIRADEEALVTRFGKHQTVLAPGLYWRWPLPFERVHREAVDRLRTIQLGFRATGVTESRADEFLGPIEWQAEHTDGNYQPISGEADMLSGEEIPVELTAEVLYQIRDFPQFVYGAANVEQVLRGLAEKSIRQTVARWAMEDILTAKRAELAKESLRLIQEGARSYELGVEVVGVNLLDVHPPVAIVPNYRDVANALEEREQLLNEAQTMYVRELFSAVGETAVRQLEHSANRQQPVLRKLAPDQVPNWKLDDAIWAALVAGQPGQPALAGQAGALLQAARQSETEQKESATGDAARFATLLVPYQAQPWLTRLHLYWTALEKSLANATLTIVDPEAKGRRQLFLNDALPADPIPPPVIATPPVQEPEN